MRAALEVQGISVGRGNSPENRTLSDPFNKPRHAQIDSLPEWYSSDPAADHDGAMALDEAVSPGGTLATASSALS